MYLIEPTTITDAMLTSSNVAEADASEWDGGTAYTVGQQVIVTSLTKSNTVGSNYLNSHRANFVNGNAYFWAVSTNLSTYVGTDTGLTVCKITLTDSAGKKAVGYIGAGGNGGPLYAASPSLKFDTLYSDSYWGLSGGGGSFPLNQNTLSMVGGSGYAYTDANVVTLGQLYYSTLDIYAYTSGSVAYCYGNLTTVGTARSTVSETHQEWAIGGATGKLYMDFLSASTMTIRGSILKLQACVEPPNASSGGVHIVSAPNGTYRGWESIETGFLYNEIATYEIEGSVTPYHRVYECLVNNTNYFPPNNLTGSSPKWMEVSATNRWKAFDVKIQDQVSNADSIQYVLTPGSLDSVAFFNLDANSVTVLLTNGGATVYNQTVTLSGAKNCVKMDIPTGYTAGVLTLTVTKTGSTAKVGEIVMGLKYYLGITLLDPATVGAVDYSDKDVDGFGNYYLTAGAYSSTGDFELDVTYANVDAVFEKLMEYHTTPIVYVGDSDISLTLLYGFFKDFSMRFDRRTLAALPIQLVSLI